MTTTEISSRALHGFWLSPYVSTVAQLLKEADLDFTYRRVSPFTGDTQAADYKQLNPFAKVPSLIEPDGVVLAESQTICRYLARTYVSAEPFYPCRDALRCAEVDHILDFLTFSISGPYFNWFVVGAYFPKAFGLNTQVESGIFSNLSMVMINMSTERLLHGAKLAPYLLGSEPMLPDFHLFQVLELGKTFSVMFDIPPLDLTLGNAALQDYYQAMSERPSSQEIHIEQQNERDETQREIFEEFGKAMGGPLRQGLSALFGREV